MRPPLPFAGALPNPDPLGIMPRLTDAETRLARLCEERALLDAIHERELARVDGAIAAVQTELSDLRFVRLQAHLGDVALRQAAQGRRSA